MGEPGRGNRLGAYALGAVGLLTGIVKLILFIRHLVGTPEDELIAIRNDFKWVKEILYDSEWIKSVEAHYSKDQEKVSRWIAYGFTIDAGIQALTCLALMIGNTQYGNLVTFLPLEFYVKLILADF